MGAKHLNVRAWITLGLACALGAQAPVARADDGSEDRLARPEALLLEQTERIRRLEDDVSHWRQQAESRPAVAERVVRTQATRAAPRAAPAAAAVAPYEQPGITPDERVELTRLSGGADRLVRAPSALVGRASTGGVRWGGYLTAEMRANSSRNTTFDLHRLILQLDAPITDCVDFTAEVEIEHGGIGGGSDGDVRVEQAVVTARLVDWFQPKIGAPLIPFGRYNLHHDDPLADFTIRPWTARYFVPTGFGQPGIGVEGSIGVGCDARLAYDVVLTSGFADDFTAGGGVRGGRQEWDVDNNENKQLWARVVLAGRNRFLDRYEIGLSGTTGKLDDAGDEALTGWGVDWLLRKGPFELQGEYLRYDIDRGAGAPAGTVHGLDGLWAEAAWHFMPCAWRACDTCLITPTSHFTLAARYQTTDLDDRSVGAAKQDDAESFGVALNYRLTERTVLRLDHTWLHFENAADERELTFSLSTYF